MENIINAFGIDVRLIVVQIINFTILMVALGYFLYTPVLNLLRDREEKIVAGIRDAEAAAAAKAAADVEKKAILSEAHQAAVDVNARAKVAADINASEIMAKAEASAEAAKAKAIAEAAQLKAVALKESEAEIAKTAILVAEKILRQKMS